MSINKVKVSVIIAAHHEGRLAHPTLNSLYRSANYAAERGIETEIIVVLDKPDTKTIQYFDNLDKNIDQKYIVEFGDPGSTRNYGVAHASGEYVAFLDADNLFCINWLHDATRYLETLPSSEKVVAHPNYIVTFEAKAILWEQIPSTDARFCVTNMFEFNYWDTVSVLHRSTAQQYPFKSSILKFGFYADDWEWNCRLLVAGVEHHIVPKTAYFRREKFIGSVLNTHRAVNSVVLPNELFQPNVLRSLLENLSK